MWFSSAREGRLEINYTPKATTVLSCLEDLFSQTDGKAVFRTQKKKICMFFLTWKNCCPKVTSECNVYSSILLDLSVQIFGTLKCNMHSHTGCTKCQHVVAARNRSIPVPTSHNEISCEVFSAVLFVVAIAVWVEVWKRFSHVSFSFVGGFWIWLQSSDLSFACRKSRFLSVTTEI